MLVISFHHGIATISLTAFSFLCVITGFVKSIGSLYVLFTFSGFHLHACTYSWHHWIRLIESLVTRRHFLYRANGTCPWTCPVQGVNWVEFVLRMFYSCNEYSVCLCVSGVCGRTPNALIFLAHSYTPPLAAGWPAFTVFVIFLSVCVCVSGTPTSRHLWQQIVSGHDTRLQHATCPLLMKLVYPSR